MKKLFNFKNDSNTLIESDNNTVRGDIAVIGMGLRVGDCDTPDKFWAALKDKRDFVTSPSEQRKRDTEVFINRSGAEFPNLAYMEGYDLFDSNFFNIAPNKSSLMDPQLKIMLQTALWAAEDAGYGGNSLSGERAGVFIGGYGSFDAYQKAVENIDDNNTLLELLTPSMLCAKISNFLNLNGPSYLIDTACSSSLSALHNASVSIINGECSMAFVGASKLILDPIRKGKKTEIESYDGRTRAFDKDSDGTGGGEACVVVLLKALDKAIEDRDDIYAVIAGSAVNRNNFSVNITAPDSSAQCEVIKSAWQAAEIDPLELSFIEGHGTGTKLGDLLEIEGLNRAFACYTDKKSICPIGSVKTNVGHTDNVSGLLSFVKAVLSIKYREFPAMVHFTEPNSNIDFDNASVYPTKDIVKLRNQVCYGGVSSFGLSGVNVHIVVKTPPLVKDNHESSSLYLFLISAKSEWSIKSLIEKWIQFLFNSQLDSGDISYTLLLGRGHYSKRVGFLFRDNVDLLNRLKNFADGGTTQDIFYGDSENNNLSLNGGERSINHFSSKNEIRYLEEILKDYLSGGEPDFGKLFKQGRYKRVHLPVYPFEPKRSWFKTKISPRFSFFDNNFIKSGRFYSYSASGSSKTSWIFNEHQLKERSILPASAIVDQVFEIAQKIYGDNPKRVSGLYLRKFVEIPIDNEFQFVVNVHQEGKSRRCFFEFFNGKEWITAAECLISSIDQLKIEKFKYNIAEDFPNKYASKENFQKQNHDITVSSRWDCLDYAGEGVDGSGSVLSVDFQDRFDAERYFFYPPLGDIALNFHKRSALGLPYSFEEIEIFKNLPLECFSVSKFKGEDAKFLYFDIIISDREGNVAINIKNYTVAKLSGSPSEYYHFKKWIYIGKFEPYIAKENILLFYGGDVKNKNRDKTISVCWRDSNSDSGMIKVSEDELGNMLSQYKPINSKKLVYILPDSFKSPKDVLRKLFIFLSALSTKVSGQIDLIITGSDSSILLHSSAAAMGRTLELERIDTRFSFAATNSIPPEKLFSLIGTAGFIFRERDGIIERLQLVYGEADQPLPLKDRGRYLITGGLGGIGIFIGEYISKRVNAEIVFLSRSGFSAEEEWEKLIPLGGRASLIVKSLRQIKERGSTFKIVSVDISKFDDVRKFKDDEGAFTGIFHFAGVAKDKFFNSSDIDRFMETIAPKIDGSLNLTQIFDDAEFIMFASSLSAVTGAPGQAGYSAANAFMDTLAELNSDKKFFSFGWSEWRGIGMAVGGKDLLKDDTFSPIYSKDAEICFDNMPLSNYAAVGKSLEPNKIYFMSGDDIRKEYFASSNREISTQDKELKSQIKLTGSQNFTKTQLIVGTIWGEELGYESLDIFDNYQDLGGDSMTSLSIAEKFRKIFNMQFSFNELFENKTVADMAEYIDKIIFLKDSASNINEENIVILKKGGKENIFCFPAGTGHAYIYYDIAKLIDGFNFYAFNYTIIDNPDENLADMVERIQPEGALTFIGYSIGGNLSYETALILKKRGREIKMIILIDSYRRLESFNFTDDEYKKNAEDYLVAVDPRFINSENREVIIKVIEHYDRFIDSRVQDSFVDFPIHYIRGEDEIKNSPFKISKDGWGELTHNFFIYQGSGDHIEMLNAYHLVKNVNIIKNILETGVKIS